MAFGGTCRATYYKHCCGLVAIQVCGGDLWVLGNIKSVWEYCIGEYGGSYGLFAICMLNLFAMQYLFYSCIGRKGEKWRKGMRLIN